MSASVSENNISAQCDDGLSAENIGQVITRGIDEILEFVQGARFKLILSELGQLDAQDRQEFVDKVILNPIELLHRGITIPLGLAIQKSKFADGRPTLFCVSKAIDGPKPWHKVTITFDNDFLPETRLVKLVK